MGRAKENTYLILNEEETVNLYEEITKYKIKKDDNNRIILNMSNSYLAEYLNAKYGSKYSIGENRCTAVDDVIYLDYAGRLKSCRSNTQHIANLKEQNIEQSISGFSDFMKMKRGFAVKMNCDCIYNTICNVCCLSKEKDKKEICFEIDKRYKIDDLQEKRYFSTVNAICFFDNPKLDFYNIFFARLQEQVSYEAAGYYILKAISEKAKTSLEIAKELNMDSELIFRFLIQEYTKSHVNMLGVIQC